MTKGQRHELMRAAGVALALAILGTGPGTSTCADERPLEVVWIWSGALTTTSATIKAKVRGRTEGLELLVDVDRSFVLPRRIPATEASGPTTSGVLTFTVTGLASNVRYYYALTNGDRRTQRGEFTTFGAGPASFEFAAASCAGGGLLSHVSNHPIFSTIDNRRPLFFVHMGDFHYLNIDRNDVAVYRRAYDQVLGQRQQADFFRHTPLVYMWDDHDYGPNDSDRTSPSRSAARLAYDENVPHYPLTRDGEDVGTIQQEFTVGRVRFLVTDLRSARDPVSTPDGPDKSMLGLRQREWLVKAFERAAADGSPLIFWVSTVPWITREGSREDGWEPYAWERRYLADRLAALGLTRRVVMVSGDAHMVAIDNGTHSNYATDAVAGEPGFPVLQAAPLDRSPTIKGGPYSHGVSDRNNQFGWIEVRDDGRDVAVVLSGLDVNGRQIKGMRLALTCSAGVCSAER